MQNNNRTERNKESLQNNNRIKKEESLQNNDGIERNEEFLQNNDTNMLDSSTGSTKHLKEVHQLLFSTILV